MKYTTMPWLGILRDEGIGFLWAQERRTEAEILTRWKTEGLLGDLGSDSGSESSVRMDWMSLKDEHENDFERG